jgi:N-acetylglucosaminyl-diphospho-decaprenol L-rhamnosyltransferase
MASATAPVQHQLRTSALPARRAPASRKSVLRKPRLSVIIVNYCLWEETAQLVRQLRASPATRRGEVEVVVVDNHSPANALVRRLRRCPEVSLRRWDRNRGFARAVNEGLRLSRGEWFLLLNPDITVGPGFVEGVLDLAERLVREDPRAGVVGFQLRNSDGSRQLSSGPFPTLSQTLARLCLPRGRRKYHFTRARRRRRVPWVTGCCVLLRRACVEQLGGLDGDYFLYYEDVDLCQRARALGWSVWYEPSLRAIHHHPLHLREVPAHLRVLTRHGLLTYACKHWPAWQFQLLSGIVALEARWRRHWALERGNRVAADSFGMLRDIAGEFGRGRLVRARHLLDRIVRREERARAS